MEVNYRMTFFFKVNDMRGLKIPKEYWKVVKRRRRDTLWEWSLDFITTASLNSPNVDTNKTGDNFRPGIVRYSTNINKNNNQDTSQLKQLKRPRHMKSSPFFGWLISSDYWNNSKGHRGRDRMIVGFTTNCVISCCH
jgi:hypothetical protein